MNIYSTQPITFGSIDTYPLASRKSKVHVREFAKLPASNAALAKFLDSLRCSDEVDTLEPLIAGKLPLDFVDIALEMFPEDR